MSDNFAATQKSRDSWEIRQPRPVGEPLDYDLGYYSSEDVRCVWLFEPYGGADVVEDEQD